MPTAYLMRAVGFEHGIRCPHAGQWLESFDHDANNGQGYGTFTPNVLDAKRFKSLTELLAFWNKESSVRPLRPDGQPNKPLTCLTITIEELP